LCWGSRLHSCAIICKSVNITMPAQQPDLRPGQCLQLLCYYLRPGQCIQLLCYYLRPGQCLQLLCYYLRPGQCLQLGQLCYYLRPGHCLQLGQLCYYLRPGHYLQLRQLCYYLRPGTVYSYCATIWDLATVYSYLLLFQTWPPLTLSVLLFRGLATVYSFINTEKFLQF
jgi:hypothetical protein